MLTIAAINAIFRASSSKQKKQFKVPGLYVYVSTWLKQRYDYDYDFDYDRYFSNGIQACTYSLRLAYVRFQNRHENGRLPSIEMNRRPASSMG